MVTFMHPDNTSESRIAAPTARIYINGRALLCFSKDNNRAEVGFLTIPRHDLLLAIYDKYNNLLPGTPVTATAGTRIVINSTHPGLGYLYFPPPQPPRDADFRNLLDLDRLHKYFDDERVEIKTEYPFLAEVYISNALFFSHSLSREKGKVFISGGSSEQTVTSRRRIGKIIGAEIDDDEFQVQVNAQLFNLKKSDVDSPYTIVIRHKCTHEMPGVASDFEKFYDVLTLPNEEHKPLDLEYERIEYPEPVPPEQAMIVRYKEDMEFKERVDNSTDLSKLFENIISATEACQAATKTECPQNLRGTETCP